MNLKPTMILAATLCASVTLAHSAVQNEAVKARMAVMEDTKNAMGVIGGMAKGAIAFDAAKAEEAKAALIAAAADVPAKFEAQETDPESEALPAIWENWDDFVAKADAMKAAAEAMDTASLDGLRAGIGGIGQTCGACHKSYRMD